MSLLNLMTSHLKYTQVELKIDVTVINKELEVVVPLGLPLQYKLQHVKFIWLGSMKKSCSEERKKTRSFNFVPTKARKETPKYNKPIAISLKQTKEETSVNNPTEHILYIASVVLMLFYYLIFRSNFVF